MYKKSFSNHGKESLHGYIELCTNKNERILEPRNQITFACVKTLTPMSLKVCCQNAKLLTPHLQNVQLYNHGGVDDFSYDIAIQSLSNQ
jgi:hypothetical protein